MSDNTLHSLLAPSSAARRFQCPGSTLAEAQFPEPGDSEPAREGEAAHWGASEMLAGRAIAEGLIAPNGVYLTEEMVEGAELYVDHVAAELQPYGMVPAQGVIEQRVAIPRVHAASFGTPDYCIWLPQSKRLWIVDYKFGFGRVEVFENRQLIEYAAGRLDDLAPGVLVTFTIVQPRAPHPQGPIRSWTARAVDLLPLIDQQRQAAEEALGPSPRFKVGLECKNCRARHACPTLQAAALDAVETARHAPPVEMTLPAMALELRALKRHEALLKARASGLEEQLLAHARRGAAVPGWRVEHGAGREVWSVPDEQVIAIGQALGVNVAKSPQALTPKQAVKAGLNPAVLAGITATPRGEAKLVEFDGSIARRVFSA